MDFALFVFLNFLLLVRPEDLYPPIAGFRLYLVTIVVCTVTALPALQRTLSRETLRTQPIAVCVVGMLGATFLSFAFRGRWTFQCACDDHIGRAGRPSCPAWACRAPCVPEKAPAGPMGHVMHGEGKIGPHVGANGRLVHIRPRAPGGWAELGRAGPGRAGPSWAGLGRAAQGRAGPRCTHWPSPDP